MSFANITNNTDITAIILSAGLSKRMGRFKPLLPLGTRRTIERVVNLFQTGGISSILVVAGHRAPDIYRAIKPLNIRGVINSDYKQGMFASVLTGIRALPDPCRAFFIHPVDIPLVRPQTVQHMTTAIKDNSAAILYPAFSGRRGHPTLIRTCMVPSIMQWPGAGGLKACLQRHEADSLEIPVVDEGILLDIDTPGDYHRMQARLSNEGLPSAEECRVLMDEFQDLPASIARHSRAVSVVAQRLARALQVAHVVLDLELVSTAALLHDIARIRKKDHADIGADLLEYHGFERLAPIVRAHMDLALNFDSPIDEIQVVYLADKLVLGDRRVDLEERFARQMEKYSEQRHIVEAIARRRENARYIEAKVEKITSRSIAAIAGALGPLNGEA